jgi:uncharacterized membrane protein
MLIFTAISGALSAIPYLGAIIVFIITGPLTLGLYSCLVKLVRHEAFNIENLFDGFKNFSTSFVLMIVSQLFVFLWSLLLIIPGIIAYYRYAMAFFILNDNPELSAMDALKASKEMMVGYKWKLFCLQFSFIGWAILCIFTLGIGYLWLIPYMYTSTANFYENLKTSSMGNANMTF